MQKVVSQLYEYVYIGYLANPLHFLHLCDTTWPGTMSPLSNPKQWEGQATTLTEFGMGDFKTLPWSSGKETHSFFLVGKDEGLGLSKQNILKSNQIFLKPT